MRDMIKQVLDFAAKCPHIRIVGMEGSRTNKNVPKDEFQDFDITYFVDDIGYFTQNDDWLTYFWNDHHDAEAGRHGAVSARTARLQLFDFI